MRRKVKLNHQNLALSRSTPALDAVADVPKRISSRISLETEDNDSADLGWPDDEASSSLDHYVRLEIVLPDKRLIELETEAKTPMMDLLVQVTTRNKMNPGGLMFRVPSDRPPGYLSYKPSTPVGKLGSSYIEIVPKTSMVELPKKQKQTTTNLPFERSIRIQVDLADGRKVCERVNPRATFAATKDQICAARGLNSADYELRVAAAAGLNVDPQQQLASIGSLHFVLTRPAAADFRKSTGNLMMPSKRNVAHRKKSFFGFFSKKKDAAFEAQVENRRKPKSHDQLDSEQRRDLATAKPKPSDWSETKPEPRVSQLVSSSRTSRVKEWVRSTEETVYPVKKKRQAPKPPEPQVRLSSLNRITKPVSRQNSNSSGYHENADLSEGVRSSAAFAQVSDVGSEPSTSDNSAEDSGHYSSMEKSRETKKENLNRKKTTAPALPSDAVEERAPADLSKKTATQTSDDQTSETVDVLNGKGEKHYDGSIENTTISTTTQIKCKPVPDYGVIGNVKKMTDHIKSVNQELSVTQLNDTPAGVAVNCLEDPILAGNHNVTFVKKIQSKSEKQRQLVVKSHRQKSRPSISVECFKKEIIPSSDISQNETIPGFGCIKQDLQEERLYKEYETLRTMFKKWKQLLNNQEKPARFNLRPQEQEVLEFQTLQSNLIEQHQLVRSMCEMIDKGADISHSDR